MSLSILSPIPMTITSSLMGGVWFETWMCRKWLHGYLCEILQLITGYMISLVPAQVKSDLQRKRKYSLMGWIYLQLSPALLCPPNITHMILRPSLFRCSFASIYQHQPKTKMGRPGNKARWGEAGAIPELDDSYVGHVLAMHPCTAYIIEQKTTATLTAKVSKNYS